MTRTLTERHPPPLSSGSRLFRARTVIKLAVGLLTVDDVETVRDGGPHAAHLEVEPLLVLRAVHVGVEQQVVLQPARSEGRQEREGSDRQPSTLRTCASQTQDPGSRCAGE